MFVATNSHVKTKAGWFLIIMSGLPWSLMFVVPFMNISNPVFLAGLLYGLSQLMWLMGIWCVGREALKKINTFTNRYPLLRRLLNTFQNRSPAWFKNKFFQTQDRRSRLVGGVGPKILDGYKVERSLEKTSF